MEFIANSIYYSGLSIPDLVILKLSRIVFSAEFFKWEIHVSQHFAAIDKCRWTSSSQYK